MGNSSGKWDGRVRQKPTVEVAGDGRPVRSRTRRAHRPDHSSSVRPHRRHNRTQSERPTQHNKHEDDLTVVHSAENPPKWYSPREGVSVYEIRETYVGPVSDTMEKKLRGQSPHKEESSTKKYDSFDDFTTVQAAPPVLRPQGSSALEIDDIPPSSYIRLKQEKNRSQNTVNQNEVNPMNSENMSLNSSNSEKIQNSFNSSNSETERLHYLSEFSPPPKIVTQDKSSYHKKVVEYELDQFGNMIRKVVKLETNKHEDSDKKDDETSKKTLPIDKKNGPVPLLASARSTHKTVPVSSKSNSQSTVASKKEPKISSASSDCDLVETSLNVSRDKEFHIVKMFPNDSAVFHCGEVDSEITKGLIANKITFKSVGLYPGSHELAENIPSSTVCCKGRQEDDGSPNQDSFFALHINNEIDICGVIDGHGPDGHLISGRLAESLVFFIVSHPSWPSQPGKCLKDAFHKANDDLLNWGKKFWLDVQESGAAAVVSIRVAKQIWVAHVGDCRAYLVYPQAQNIDKSQFKEILVGPDHSIVPLTVDHKAGNEIERQKIKARGGHIALGSDGEYRVLTSNGTIGLALTRTFGDTHAVEAGVDCQPEINTWTIPVNCGAFLCLGSDGVWDAVSPRQGLLAAAKTLSECGLQKAAASLATRSLNKWIESIGHSDDITVQLARLGSVQPYTFRAPGGSRGVSPAGGSRGGARDVSPAGGSRGVARDVPPGGGLRGVARGVRKSGSDGDDERSR
eukprot:GHVL01021415.1.p1 GENE.GHVL01021415.1~~GHVL01021415.1.p1  ORF type:complete len:754 (+),score=122.34 GHVL01021415.1:44-2263(+)